MEFDVVVVGAGSAGAVVAARLSEDPSVRVALLEAGGPPPPEESMPAAVSALQLNPETDWMLTGDAGGVGKGLAGGRMMVPRGKMLGGSSGINYMAYVRGHPGDFDAWGADGWSSEQVLPYFKKSEGLQPSGDIVVDHDSHNPDGPLGVSVRSPVVPAAQQFVDAAAAIGIAPGDYNGRDRERPEGVASLFQTTTKDGRRSSTFHAFLEPVMDERENLVVLTRARVQRLVLDDDLACTGVEYLDADGVLQTVTASREVVLSAGAIGSPQLLLLSGIGPSAELAEVGIDCRVDLPDVGKHLKDHLHTPMVFPAPGIGLPMTEVAVARSARTPCAPPPARSRPTPPTTPTSRRSSPPSRPRRSAARRVGHHRAAAWSPPRSTTPASGTPPASATRTPTTRRSGSSSAATRPTSGAACSGSTRPSTSPTPRRSPRTGRSSSSCRTRCSRTARARCASPAPTRWPSR